jgi:hypothetical protein
MMTSRPLRNNARADRPLTDGCSVLARCAIAREPTRCLAPSSDVEALEEEIAGDAEAAVTRNVRGISLLAQAGALASGRIGQLRLRTKNDSPENGSNPCRADALPSMNDHQVDHASIIAFADTLSMRTSHFFGEAHRSEMILADFLSLKSSRRSMIKEARRAGERSKRR